MPVQERVKCRCGMAMMPTTGDGEGYVCPNCDHVQPQEAIGFERRKTAQDIRYEMFWLRVMTNEYPQMPEGWAENKPGSDIPPVGTTNSGDTDEGETNE